MRAHFKYIHTAPRKLRLILDQLRGASASVTESKLKLMPHQSARDIVAVLHSAIHNAKESGIDTEHLIIQSAVCDDGPRVKRRILASRGRAKPISKQMSHIKISLISAKDVNKVAKKSLPRKNQV